MSPRRELSAAERRRALAELAKRKNARRAINFLALCHAAQRAFATDDSPLVSACCSRRAGKSWGLAYKMLHVAQQHAWSTVLYLTNTRPQAKRIMWGVLQRLNAELGLKGTFNAVELIMKLPNGSQIQLGGCNDEYEIERYRGPSYPLVVIDEAQSIRPFMKRLIEDILEPATMDYNGQILLAGTPNATGVGYFADVSKGRVKGWSLHSWTVLENPKIPHARAWLEARKQRRGWTDATPKYRREYRAEWVRDTSSQVYQIGEKNIIPAWPRESAKDWEYVLGVDLGFVGVSAFVVCAYSVLLGQIVVLESHQITPSHFGPDVLLLTPDLLAREIRTLQARFDFAGIVIDPGSLGAKFIKDIKRRFKIRAEPAEKQAKLGAIELLNGDLQAGRVLVVEGRNADLLHDAGLLEWRRSNGLGDDEEDDEGGGALVARADLAIDNRTPNHLTDALTYAYRRCRAYLHDPKEDEQRPPAGSLEHEELLEREREEREIAKSGAGDDWWAEDLDGSIYRVIRRLRAMLARALAPMGQAA